MAVQSSAPRRATASKRTAGSTTGARRSSARAGTGAASRVKKSKDAAALTAGEGQRVASTAKVRSQALARTARSQGREVARTASRDAGQLTTTVKAQATQVREELTVQSRAVLDEAKARVAEQAHVHVRRAGDGLTKLAKGTRALAEGAPGEDAGLGGYLFQGAEKISAAADRLYGLADDVEAGDLDRLLDDVQTFARRRPAAFVIGAAVAGFGIGRVLRTPSEDDDVEAEDDIDVEGDVPPALPRRAAAGAR